MANFNKKYDDTHNQTVIIIQAVIIIALLLVLGISLGIISIPGLTKTVEKSTIHKITYRITSSSGKAGVAYTQTNGVRSELMSINTPWSMTSSFSTGTTVFLLAGNTTSSGDLTCEISLDGQLLRRDHAVFPATKVACALPIY